MKKIILTAAALIFSAGIAKAEVNTQFTSKIENKEPADVLEVVTKDLDNVMIHTNITGEEGKTVYHVWKKDDIEIYKRAFDVKGPRWRVWTSVSTHHFEPSDTVVVEIQDNEGNILETAKIEVKEAE